MMRPVSIQVPRALPVAPVLSNPPGAGVTLDWTDGTPVDYATPASWTNPGTAEIGFRIERQSIASNGTVGALTVIDTAQANTTTFTDNTASGGLRYTYRVVAFNAAGDSPSTGLLVTAGVTAPGAPVIGTATAGNASAVVNWTAPANTGGPTRTGYLVQTFVAGLQVGGTTQAAANATSLTVTGLANGTPVQFRVAATNAVGPGAYSALSAAVTPATVPGAPVIGTVTRGNASALVRWTAPATGGSPNTGYSVAVVNAANTQVGALRPAGAGATSLTVTGLVNGTAYRFKVAAKNLAGPGPYSALSAAVTPATAPGPPVIGPAAVGTPGGPVTAWAHWTPPVSNGGLAINGYQVIALRMTPGGTVVSLTRSVFLPASARYLNMYLVPGLYRFVIQARNEQGLSLWSSRSALVTAQ